MKKRVVIILSIMLTLAMLMIGCGDSDVKPENLPSVSKTSDSDEKETSATEVPEPSSTPVPTASTIYKGTTVEPSKANVGDVILFGLYEQDNNDSNGEEAIPWYVLDKDGDRLLLLSVYLLEPVGYDNNYLGIKWGECSLRTWMNEIFYSRAFTEKERMYISTSYLENSKNPYYGVSGGEDTEDKVFALSLDEVEQYFGISGVEEKEGILGDKYCYWHSEKQELVSGIKTLYAKAKSPASGNCWWLRSPGDSSNKASYVTDDGKISLCGAQVDIDYFAARPALCLDLNPTPPTPTLSPTPSPSPSPSPTAPPTPSPTPTNAPVPFNVYSGETVELSEAEVGDVVLFGAYEQDGIESNGTEIIPWYVLEKNEDKLLLLSMYILDSMPYNETKISIEWTNCTLRQWLNREFYINAFDEAERNRILTSQLINQDNPYYGASGGPDTEDKLFILSINEAKQYFGITEDEGHFWRSENLKFSAAEVTAYAEKKGLSVSEDEESIRCGWWWLRTPGYEQNVAASFFYDYGGTGGSIVDDNNIGVRPALWISLNH